jgi:hypothetical protein
VSNLPVDILAETAKPERRLGRAVLNGRIRFLSVSQIVQADPRLDGGCKRRWAFVKIFGKEEPENEAQRAGSKEYAAQLQHHLKSGEDCLGPVLRAAKHYFPKPGPDLEVEKDLAVDIEAAIKLREQLLWSKVDDAESLHREMRRLAGLTIAGIPVTGAADFRHRRGEFVDASGLWQREDASMRVVSVGDLKSTSRIDDYVSRGGEGKRYRGYAKTDAEVLAHPQMIGYGVHAADLYPDTTHVRLFHVYAQTKNGYAAALRGGLLTVDEVRRRWRESVEPVARDMVEIAANATKPEDVPYNLASCDAYRGCPHADYCDRPKGTVNDLFHVPTQGGTPMAGLFDDAPAAPAHPHSNGAQAVNPGFAPPPPTQPVRPAVAGLFDAPPPQEPSAPPAPPMTEAERQARIEAERVRLAAEDSNRAPPPPPAQPAAAGDAVSLPGSATQAAYFRGIDGYEIGMHCNGHGYYINNRNRQGFITIERGHRCPACTETSNRTIASVNPPDRPPLDPVAAATPLPPETIAQIADPALQAKVVAHSQAAAARAVEEQKSAPAGDKKTGGRCPQSSALIPLTAEQAVKRAMTCACGKAWKKVPDKDLKIEDGKVIWVVAVHNLPKVDAAPAQPASAPPPEPSAPPEPVYAAPGALPGQTAMPAVVDAPPEPSMQAQKTAAIVEGVKLAAQLLPPVAPPQPTLQQGITLLVDIVTERGGDGVQSLDAYVTDVVETLQKAAGLKDLRYAPEKHDLALGRWKGALIQAVRFDPPKPGVYTVRNFMGSEITNAVIEALTPLCRDIYRGVA